MGKVEFCSETTFHGIDCLESGDNFGFEGCYGGDINHPDPRPGHAIWIKKLDAEKLFKLFSDCVKFDKYTSREGFVEDQHARLSEEMENERNN